MSTFRADYAARLKTILDDFRGAHGDLLRSTFRVRPPALATTDLPTGWVDRRPEEVRLDSGTKERVTPASITLAFPYTDNDELMATVDATVDLFYSHVTQPSYAHVAGGTWDRMAIEDDFDETSGLWLVRFTFANVSVMEGRS